MTNTIATAATVPEINHLELTDLWDALAQRAGVIFCARRCSACSLHLSMSQVVG